MLSNKKTDKILVRDFIDGDYNSFEILFNRHTDRLFSFVMSKVKDRDLADDIFQDTFEATLEVNQGGQLSLVSVTIDDLCSVEDCSGSSAAFGGGVCGGHQYTTGQCQGESGGCKADTDCKQGPCVFGLVPSTVDFDKDDVYNTPWQKLTKDVTGLSGSGPVTLRLFATDTGDSIYDSAILVDSISFD